MRSPERTGSFSARHGDFEPPYRGGYDGPSDRHYEGRRDDERWGEDYGTYSAEGHV